MKFTPCGLGELRPLDAPIERALCKLARMQIAVKPAARPVDHWEAGWQENLAAYKADGSHSSLRPKYIRPGLPLRKDGHFVIPDLVDYEWEWYRQFLGFIADQWFDDCEGIHEFGCGSAHNVAFLADYYPEKFVVGYDWTTASFDICKEIRSRTGNRRVWGCPFDFYKPVGPMLPGSVALTVGALEQTGKKWGQFLEYLLEARPKRVVHLEPVYELYDENNEVDQVAMEAHRSRGFWDGYLAILKDLEDQEAIKIEHVERTGFGSFLIEGYSQIVWRPI